MQKSFQTNESGGKEIEEENVEETNVKMDQSILEENKEETKSGFKTEKLWKKVWRNVKWTW